MADLHRERLLGAQLAADPLLLAQDRRVVVDATEPLAGRDQQVQEQPLGRLSLQAAFGPGRGGLRGR